VCRRRRAQGGVVAHERALEHLDQVLEEVEAVGHLDRLRRAAPDALGVRPGTVAAHDLELGMSAEPGGERRRGAVRQEVEHAVPACASKSTRIVP
jgi:hypothetical protein